MTVPVLDEMASPRIDDRPHARQKTIDGWRAIAAGAVVLSHAVNFRFGGAPGAVMYFARRVSGLLADLGVQFFFVISGFIITSLLIRERACRGSVSIAAFYARRVCRIVPPLVAYYAVVLVLAGLGFLALPWPSLLASASFTCNTGIVDCVWWVAHTWSLAVEEQFYIGWPILFSLVAAATTPRLLAFVLVGCTIGACVQGPVQHANFTSFACIAAGALYATEPRLRQAIAASSGYIRWFIIAAVVIIGPLIKAAPVVTPLLPLLATYLIFAGNALPFVRAVLQSPPCQLIGLCSYSLYIWQQLFLAKPGHYVDKPISLLWLPVAVLASVWLIERPFIRLGRRLSRLAERPDSAEQPSPS